jgi:hypothetical protein
LLVEDRGATPADVMAEAFDTAYSRLIISGRRVDLDAIRSLATGGAARAQQRQLADMLAASSRRDMPYSRDSGAPRRTSREICRNFQAGRCSFSSDKCKWRHECTRCVSRSHGEERCGVQPFDHQLFLLGWPRTTLIQIGS